MAVLSTMQYIPTEVDTATMHLMQSVHAHGQSNIEDGIVTCSSTLNESMPSASQLTHDSLSSTPTSANGYMAVTSSSAVTGIHVDHKHSSAPTDGETVWFCSECFNGPMGNWYNACPCCGHQYCSSCKVEQT